jgi:spermidine synthase
MALFFVSGATGLLYEVAFSKLLAYVFGATAYAVSAVLAAFMGGLALGAHFGGRFGARAKRPLVTYGMLEIVVAMMCALSPVALGWVTSAYVSIARSAPESVATVTAARALLTGLVVVIPTVAMGATLPVLARVVTAGDESDRGRRLSRLYAINTAGGAIGSLASAYAILPALGVLGTMRGAALANVAIGVVAIVIGLRDPMPKHAASDVKPGAAGSDEPAPTAAIDPDDRILFSLAIASGFLVFAAEVVQTHLLALLIGNSAYAFGLMLAVFLVCLAIGAARATGFSKKHGTAALARGLAVAAIALLVVQPLWDQLPIVFAFAGKHVASWAGRELVRALVALVIIAPPTLWMGTTFPLLLERVASRPNVSAVVGRLTVANTLGTIAGSILTGYLILPALGSQRGLGAIAAIFALFGVLATRLANVEKKERTRAMVFAAVALVGAVVLPRWDLARLTSGANVYFAMGPRPESIDFVREDVHGGVTTVARRGLVHTMYTNGKFQGDDGAEMDAQRRFAHFPSLFVEHEENAFVIGLGTGTTLGTIAAYPYKRIDVCEISPAIVEASRQFYSRQAMNSLDDPRVHLELNDGRNHLLVSTTPYDLVTIETSSVWFAGAASLYGEEFYHLVHDRLTPGGILQQWVQLHHIRKRELASIVRTLRKVFPHVALFVGGAQGILVASDKPLLANPARLARLEKDPRIAAVLGGKSMDSLLDELLTSEDDLDRYVKDAEADGGPITSTDDNLHLEYATPKGNILVYESSLKATLDDLEPYRTKNVRARHVLR